MDGKPKIGHVEAAGRSFRVSSKLDETAHAAQLAQKLFAAKACALPSIFGFVALAACRPAALAYRRDADGTCAHLRAS